MARARPMTEQRMLAARRHSRSLPINEAERKAVAHMLAHYREDHTKTQDFARAILIAIADVRERKTKPVDAADAAFEVYCHGL